MQKNTIAIFVMLIMLGSSASVKADTSGSISSERLHEIAMEFVPLSDEQLNDLLTRLEDVDFLALLTIVDLQRLDESNSERYGDLYIATADNERISMSEEDHRLVLHLHNELSIKDIKPLDAENAYYGVAELLLEKLDMNDQDMAWLYAEVLKRQLNPMDMRILIEKVDTFCEKTGTQLDPSGEVYLKILKQAFPE